MGHRLCWGRDAKRDGLGRGWSFAIRRQRRCFDCRNFGHRRRLDRHFLNDRGSVQVDPGLHFSRLVQRQWHRGRRNLAGSGVKARHNFNYRLPLRSIQARPPPPPNHSTANIRRGTTVIFDKPLTLIAAAVKLKCGRCRAGFPAGLPKRKESATQPSGPKPDLPTVRRESLTYGRLAQLARAPARQAGGHRFEPCIAH